MKIRKIGAALLLTSLLTSTVALQSVAAQDTVKIGANYELSGDNASYGQAMLEGLELLVEQVNDDGGVLDGLQLEIASYDNTSDVTESAMIAQRLVEENVVGVVGPATTGAAQAAVPNLDSGGIPNILPAATGEGITLKEDGSVWEYLYRVCFEDSFQGRVGAAFASDNLGAGKAILLVDNASDYSRGLADNFIDEFNSRGGEIISEESFTAGDTDFSAILTTVLSSDADIIYIPAYYQESGLIIKQAREMGITQPIVGSDGFSSTVLVELAGAENANDVYYTDHFSAASEEPIVQEFMSAYEEKFGKEASTFVALGYDAAKLLVESVEKAGSTDPEAINEQIAATQDFEGVTGIFSINEDHNPVKSAVVIGLTDGEISSAENISVD